MQALLRLDQIEKARTSLQRVANDAKREAKQAESDDARAKQDFFQHLGHKAPKKADLLNAVNERRALLKLDPVTDLAPPNAVKQGVTADASQGPGKVRLSKVAAQNDLTSYHERIEAASDPPLAAAKAKALAALGKLTSNLALLKAVKQKALVEQGLELLDEEACPLCDTAWDIAELTAHLKQKVEKASAATAVLDELAAAAAPILDYLGNLGLAVNKLGEWCAKADPEIEADALLSYVQTTGEDRAILAKVCRDPAVISEALKALARIGAPPPAPVAVVAQPQGACGGAARPLQGRSRQGIPNRRAGKIRSLPPSSARA